MTPREIVIKRYPLAVPVNIGCKRNNKKYYHIVSNGEVLGVGKTTKAAWKAAERNTE